MGSGTRSIRRRLRAWLMPALDRALGFLLARLACAGCAGLTASGRQIFSRRFMRTVGPWLPEHTIGRANLAAAFPEKSPAEIETILRGVWDNLGRVAAEFAHVDRIVRGRSGAPALHGYTPGTAERFKRLRDDGKPALVFAAHLANWELPAVVAAADGLDTLVLYRRPNLRAVADVVIDIRKDHMGELVPTSMMRTDAAGARRWRPTATSPCWSTSTMFAAWK